MSSQALATLLVKSSSCAQASYLPQLLRDFKDELLLVGGVELILVRFLGSDYDSRQDDQI